MRSSPVPFKNSAGHLSEGFMSSGMNQAETVTVVKESSGVVENSDSVAPGAASPDSSSDVTESVKSPAHENKEDNPQDATIEASPVAAHTVDFDVRVHSSSKEDESPGSAASESPDTNKENRKVSSSRKALFRNKKRKGKRVRVAKITEISTNDGPTVKSGLSLPSNQYEVCLIRRAVRKWEEVASDEQEDIDETYGDTSLGMKLNIIGGMVIVQTVTALADGRASPAQLAGLIQRGDVILSVNGTSLVTLTDDDLMRGLGPLGTPDSTGLYERRLELRLEFGTGLDILTRYEDEQTQKAGASLDFVPVLGLDQLSGLPFFEDFVGSMPRPLEVREAQENPAEEIPQIGDAGPLPSPQPMTIVSPATANERISLALASLKKEDRRQAMSEFFAWSKRHSRLLRCDDSTVSSAMSLISADGNLTKDQYLERGQMAILGATALTRHVEEVDSGKDVRSFQCWKTTLSLHSQARTRRRFVLDAASLPLNFGKSIKEVGEESFSDHSGNDHSMGSATEEGDEENLDGDELLLRLAASDEIWRKQVIEFLEERSANRASRIAEEEPVAEELVQPEIPVTNDFSDFLFGEKISSILNKNKKSHALPPVEVTAVLFDLTTKLSASVPDEINASGINVSSRSSVVPFRATKRPAPGSQVMLATQFVLDEALPSWTKTFRPLPWDQRRLLWPAQKHSTSGSSIASTLSDDLLTLDTLSTGFTSMSSRQRKRKNLQEQIEEQELDPETKEETCFLLTYLFTQSLLPHLKDQANEDNVKKVKDFVRRFGAYLRLHTCLAYASSLKCEAVVEILLDLAQRDPQHREVIKHASQVGALMLYEPTMLSAVLQRLQTIRSESSQRLRQMTVDLAASAYPDVQPWQVRRQCISPDQGGEDDKEFVDLYYTYLSLLLHTVDGHNTARKDRELVNDWCDLSVKKMKEATEKGRPVGEYKANFIAVASRACSSHRSYKRDLKHLLQLSVDIQDFDLAISIATEILDHATLSSREQVLCIVLENMRKIALSSLRPQEPTGARLMKHILKLFVKAKRSQSAVVREKFDGPTELLGFIRGCSPGSRKEGKLVREELDLIEYLAKEAEPSDLLRALSLMNDVSGHQHEALAIMQTLLHRAANESVSSEMSVALMKVKHARMDIEQNIESQPLFEDAQEEDRNETIWKDLSHGMITIAK